MEDDTQIKETELNEIRNIQENLIIICGHYKGIDQRVRDNLDGENDYYISGLVVKGTLNF